MTHYVYLNQHRIAMINDTVTQYDSETCWGDSDQDGIEDQWEQHYFGSLDQDGSVDTDGDGFTDLEEFNQGSNPNETTVDTDALPDTWEMQYFGSLGQKPEEDFDHDGYTNQQEYQDGTDPTDNHSGAAEGADEDGDGMLDRWEMLNFGDLTRDSSGKIDMSTLIPALRIYQNIY